MHPLYVPKPRSPKHNFRPTFIKIEKIEKPDFGKEHKLVSNNYLLYSSSAISIPYHQYQTSFLKIPWIKEKESVDTCTKNLIKWVKSQENLEKTQINSIFINLPETLNQEQKYLTSVKKNP